MMTYTTREIVREYERHMARADDLLELHLTDEMYKVMRRHKVITGICRAMGSLTVFATVEEDFGDGSSGMVEKQWSDCVGEDAGPVYLKRLFTLAELDNNRFAVLTGKPLRLKRGPGGSIVAQGDW